MLLTELIPESLRLLLQQNATYPDLQDIPSSTIHSCPLASHNLSGPVSLLGK